MLCPFNVDGYAFTWTAPSSNRMWRKNRRVNSNSNCRGVDLNRNFAKGYGLAGSSSKKCSETYRGTGAFSEPESKAVSDYMYSISGSSFWKGFMSLHSYGQLWLSPWGYTSSPPADLTAQTNLGNNCAAAILATHSKVYTVGPTNPTLYAASGIAPDWTYANMSIVYSYTPELRDTGTLGFVLPPSEIQPTGEEIYAAWKVFALAAALI